MILAREGLASRLAGDIVARIAREELAPGERLPTEAGLAAQYGVSRTVVREAISRLRADGVVTARPGAGTFVSPHGWSRAFRIEPADLESRSSLLHIVELRMAFEVEAARLAAQRHSPSDLAEMRRLVDLMAEDKSSGAEEGVDADVRLHQAIALATRNPHFADFFEFIAPHVRRGIRFTRGRTGHLSQSRVKGLWQQAQNEHTAIVAAIETGNPARAAAAVRLHLRNTLRRLARHEVEE